jgi:voltage-gated sodium channel
VTEISLKILTLKRAFWQDPWNWFDLEVVDVSLAPANDAFASRRALRLLQLVAVLPSLRRAVEGFLKAIPSLSSIMLLLFIFSDMGSNVFGEQHPEAFGSLGVSVFSLFAVMTLEGWPDLAREAMRTRPTAWSFFIVFIVLSSWAVLNLVIGVVVDSMQS